LILHLIQGEGLKDLVDIRLASGDVITATAGHPLYTPEKPEDEKWTDAGQLTIDDVLQSIVQSDVRITNLYKHNEFAKVYNLTVANDHTYYVSNDEILSHNMGACKFPEFGTKQRNHIFRGDISPGGRITGYHHRFAGSDNGAFKLLKVTNPGKGSPYGGFVGFVDENGKLHKKYSTFFPNNWTTQRVIGEINSAVIVAASKGKLNGTVQAKGASGMLIEMKIRGGILESAYPVLK